MLITGIEKVAIVRVSDTNFASTVWLYNCYTNGGFRESPITEKLYDKTDYILANEYSLEFTSSDYDKYETLRSWMYNNYDVYMWVYGIRGSVVWAQSAKLVIKKEKPFAPGGFSNFSVSVSYMGIPENTADALANVINIYEGLNILPRSLRTLDAGSWVGTAGNWTLSNCTIASNMSLTNTSSNCSATLNVQRFMFPVENGDSFYIGGKPADSRSSNFIKISGFNSSGTVVADYGASGLADGGTGRNGAVATIANSTITHVKFKFGNTSTYNVEYDDVMLSYQSRTEGYVNG